MDSIFFASPDEVRDWFAAHHDESTALWIGFFKKGSGKAGITYAEALDEALCVGWIDGVRKRIDDGRFTIRFTPRQPRSIWSSVNIARAEELIALGRMLPAGRAAFDGRDPTRGRQYSFEQDEIEPASLVTEWLTHSSIDGRQCTPRHDIVDEGLYSAVADVVTWAAARTPRR